MNVTVLTDSGAEAQKSATESCETSRFGTIDVRTESIVDFPDGLIGLAGRRYALICTDVQSPFLWLQSLQTPTLALPVVNPHRFFKAFQVEVGDDDASSRGLDDGRAADVYVTVTTSKVLAEFTANLKAPIVIRDGQGHQLINQAQDCPLKAQLFPG